MVGFPRDNIYFSTETHLLLEIPERLMESHLHKHVIAILDSPELPQ